jgi:hypothetical protein
MSKLVLIALALAMAAPPIDVAAAPRSARAPKARPKPRPPEPPADPLPALPQTPPQPEPEGEPEPAAEKSQPPPRAPEPAPDTKAKATSIEALRAEYQQIKDALFRSRARRETLETALFSTQLIPTIRWDGGRHHAVKRAEVRLDGVRLWESAEGLTTDKAIALAAKSAPAGPHVLGVRVEVRSRDDAKLGYVSDQSFALSLPEGKKTTVEITIDESGDAPSYNPEIEIEVESK